MLSFVLAMPFKVDSIFLASVIAVGEDILESDFQSAAATLTSVMGSPRALRPSTKEVQTISPFESALKNTDHIDAAGSCAPMILRASSFSCVSMISSKPVSIKRKIAMALQVSIGVTYSLVEVERSMALEVPRAEMQEIANFFMLCYFFFVLFLKSD